MSTMTMPKLSQTVRIHRSYLRALTAGVFLFAASARPTQAAPGPEDVIPPPEAIAEAAPPPAAPAPEAENSAGYLPSLDGPIGLYHLSTAEVGPAHHVRLALHGQYFTSSSVLSQNDKDEMLSGALTFGYTPIRYLEIFGGVLTSSNRNDRDDPGRTDPTVIRSHGDLLLGPKVAFPVANGFNLGFETGLRFLASASSLAFSTSSTSVWFGPMGTADLRPLAGIPLRVHLNANYYVDNSKNVYDFSDTMTKSRQAAKFAYGVGASRLRLALAVDAPLEGLTGPVALQPFVEYHAELITADADPALATAASTAQGGRDRQWLTFGLRARLYRGLTVDGGADVRLRSNGLAYQPPLPPYTVIFGVSYPLDIDAFTRPVVVTKVVEKTITAPATEGRIAGVAKDKAGKGIAHAVVAVAGRPHAGVVTDADGSFEIAALAPGPASVEVSAPEFETEKVTTNVTAGRIAEVAVALTARARTGSVRGKTIDAQGHAVEATLKFSGAQALETRTDGGGLYQAALLPGPYKVVAEAPGLPTKESQFEVVADGNRQVDLVLRPLSPDLTLSDTEIVLRDPIKFKTGTGTPKLTSEWQAELDAVVAVLEDRPEIRILRVEAHWDPSAGAKAKEITDAQAAAVKDYLVKKGISDARIEAVGMSADQPLVPNVTPAYKAKNRRLELHVIR